MHIYYALNNRIWNDCTDRGELGFGSIWANIAVIDWSAKYASEPFKVVKGVLLVCIAQVHKNTTENQPRNSQRSCLALAFLPQRSPPGFWSPEVIVSSCVCRRDFSFLHIDKLEELQLKFGLFIYAVEQALLSFVKMS